jgi:hypothetical protein
MKDEALKLALDDLIAEYHMQYSSFARRVDDIFKEALVAPEDSSVVRSEEYKGAVEVSIIFHEGQKMFAVPKQPAPVQEPLTVKLKDDWRTDDFGRPIIYDTDEVDEVTHALTGDEGEEDSLTVLNRMVRYVSNVWPGKTALQVLIECEEAMIATPPAAAPVQEPVAIADGTFNHNCPIGTPLYTTPQRQWVELTDKQINNAWFLNGGGLAANRFHDFARAIESKLKEKNNG